MIGMFEASRDDLIAAVLRCSSPGVGAQMIFHPSACGKLSASRQCPSFN